MTQPAFPTAQVMTDQGWRPPTAGGSNGGGGDFAFTVERVNNADIALASTDSTAVFMRGLTAARTVSLPAAPAVGQEIVVKDEDGTLAAANIVVNGNGSTIDGIATYTMTAAVEGPFGALTLVYNGAGNWGIL